MKESEFDRLLRIQTRGIKEFQYQTSHYHRYEATPYVAMEALFQEYAYEKAECFVDFGCGKGRFPFYVHHFLQKSAVGIEMNAQLFQVSMENLTTYLTKARLSNATLSFECCLAEEYEIKPQENVCYFFNPFSLAIFRKVTNQILLSAEQHPRIIDIILYYPTDDYQQFLENETPFEFLQEVRVPGLYNRDENERFMIYRFYG